MQIRVSYVWIDFLLRGQSISKSLVLLKTLSNTREIHQLLPLFYLFILKSNNELRLGLVLNSY